MQSIKRRRQLTFPKQSILRRRTNRESLRRREEIRDYVNDFNTNKEAAYQIRGTYTFEADETKCCYICVDDVLVHRQSRVKLVHKNGKWMKRAADGDWVFHSVAYIECGGLVYIMEAMSQDMIFSRILAFLL